MDNDPMIEAFKGLAVAFTFIGGCLLVVALGVLLFQWLA
jgi:hypothetical protein